MRFNLLSSGQFLCMSSASRQNLHFARDARAAQKHVFSSKLRFAKEDFAVVASGVAFSVASQERAHGHRRVEVCASGQPVASLSTARSYCLSQRLVAVARCPSRFHVRVIMYGVHHIPGKGQSGQSFGCLFCLSKLAPICGCCFLM